jgi:hypothetical protein
MTARCHQNNPKHNGLSVGAGCYVFFNLKGDLCGFIANVKDM